MALKLRVSLYMAFAASILTVLVGAFNTIALTAILYRTLVSLVLFAVLGYACGQFAERFLQEKQETLEEADLKGTNVDIVSSDEPEAEELPIPEFTPLNPENFDNITLTQK
ncbi:MULTISPECIES: hypothetical protein [Sporomusa]|jgi:uncharacterized membrane protein|uniref:hypothetical protein n=1 Tax=Sporomusa TaxID=2375 RepID=UPI00166D944C|nr:MULTISPECIES: hypothetical protein [Sporomusa]MCM0760168.1 hypothetical protein [Sporomusa sphaeroides DSM 2875]HML31516.1 hypothetical protein [Sporomusa sphaeroides]